jgi:hypothetical protein
LLLTHIAVVLFATVGVGTPASGQTDGRTVAEVLADCGCLIADMPAALLEKRVAHVQQLIDDQGFVVAFVTSPNDRARGFEVIAGTFRRPRGSMPRFRPRRRIGSGASRRASFGGSHARSLSS